MSDPNAVLIAWKMGVDIDVMTGDGVWHPLKDYEYSKKHETEGYLAVMCLANGCEVYRSSHLTVAAIRIRTEE